MLLLSLRRWRPLPACLVALGLATAWNATPIAGQYLKGRADPASEPVYWTPAIDYLRAHLTPSYRVEAVDTAGHWGATYLAEAEIPLARGGYRQDDFPQNKVLYDELRRGPYLHWLRGLGVRYVVLTAAPPDYSARDEARLLRSGQSGLRRVFHTARLTIYAVPRPRPIVTGSAPATVLQLTGSRLVVDLADGACLIRSRDGMTTIAVRKPGRLELSFRINATSALAAVGGSTRVCDLH